MSTIADPKTAKGRLVSAFRTAQVGAGTDTENIAAVGIAGYVPPSEEALAIFDAATAVVTLYAPLRNADDLERWQTEFYAPGGRWRRARPTTAQLRAHFGYEASDPVRQQLTAFAESFGTVTATSLIGDFVVVETTGARAREALQIELVETELVDTVVLIPATDTPLPSAGSPTRTRMAAGGLSSVSSSSSFAVASPCRQSELTQNIGPFEEGETARSRSSGWSSKRPSRVRRSARRGCPFGSRDPPLSGRHSVISQRVVGRPCRSGRSPRSKASQVSSTKGAAGAPIRAAPAPLSSPAAGPTTKLGRKRRARPSGS